MDYRSTADKVQEIYHFLLKKKILIVDPSIATRTTIISILKDLGVRWTNIKQVVDFTSAERAIQESPPDILICDLHVNGGGGQALVNLRSGMGALTPGFLSIIVSRNATPAAIVDALEAGVDCYIIKPFTPESFREHFCSTIMGKLHGGVYRETIEKGIAAWAAGRADEARDTFKVAVSLSDRPGLAHYYLGKLYLEASDEKRAQEEFEAGLASDMHDFRCLLGFFDLLRDQRKFPHAYEVSRRIVEAFPLSAKRIAEILALSLEVQRFDDLSVLYKSYLNLSVRSSDLTKKMIAALLQGGEALLKLGKAGDGVDMFRKAIISSGRTRSILRKSIILLLDHHQAEMASALLSELPLDQKQDSEIRVLAFQITNCTDNPGEIFEMGQRLLKDGVFDPEVYRILAIRAKELGKGDYAEQLEHECTKRWPPGA